MGSSGKDAILTPASSAQGDVLYRDATVWTRLAAGASGNTLQSGGAGANPSWAAGGSGAVTREGGNLTEASTTSLTSVDLLTSSATTIASAEPMYLSGVARKDANGANRVAVGLKLNTIVVSEADVDQFTNALLLSEQVAEVEIASLNMWWGGRSADYTKGGGSINTSINSAGTLKRVDVAVHGANGDAPTGTITSVVLRGLVGSTPTTLFVDELNVYSFAST